MNARRVFVLLVLAGCAHKAPPPPPPAAAPVAEAPPRRDADDGIAVSGTMGELSSDEIEGPFKRRWDEVTHCYQDVTSKINYLAGKIELKVRVARSGEPKSVFVSASTFGNYEMEHCVLELARALHFPTPHGGPEAEFTYPIEFRATRGVTEWDEGRVSPSVARHRRDLQACKAKAPGALPSSLTLTMYVAPGGKVASAGLAADAPIDDQFAACLVQKTRTWRLDDPLGKIAKATVGVQ
jgi:TonB family protein